MATSDFWQRVSTSPAPSQQWAATSVNADRWTRGKAKLWMALDALTILGSAVLATIYEKHTGPIVGARQLWHGTLIHGRP
ncbi:MAG: hypothetical protein ABSF70_18985, partial [Terracidiphilus sp.]